MNKTIQAINQFSKKQKWKLALFFGAVLIGLSTMLYTNNLVQKLKNEERKKVELWAEATRQFAIADLDQDLSFITKILENNKTVPVILLDSNGKIIDAINLDSTKLANPKYLSKEIEIMAEQHEPIEITLAKGEKNFIYYKDSTILNKLIYYPILQILVMILFIIVAYLAFNASRNAEQNQVWVGMSKETAHQLGTPIMSLMAWLELLKSREGDTKFVTEVEKDVKRLEKITERFSKIGSAPVLNPANIVEVVVNATNYIKTRTSNKVEFGIHFVQNEEIIVPLNIELFEWVIENLCKNAIDAMNGQGTIDVTISDQIQVVYVDITDTGKGIPKSKYQTVFQPGFTTKKKGWGLGLSLAQRIVETNHGGKIFVKDSEINKGTTFRIVLKK